LVIFINQISLHAFFFVIKQVKSFYIYFFKEEKMKKFKSQLGFLTIVFTYSFNLHAGLIENVIYGNDNRVDVYQSTNPLFKNLAISTAAMIADTHLVDNNDSVSIEGQTLEDGDGVCSDALFSKQIAVANCSGFLLGSQYLVTAGHCIQTIGDCDRYSWVFDYANTKEEVKSFNIKKSEIYKCAEIIERSLDDKTDNDYSLVKLDRPVTNRPPLKFRTKGKISSNAKLVVIGHPSGLPTKIADDAFLRSNTNKYFFMANLDTFGGNSGSAVFDAKTGIVEGILVRGERDYEFDPAKGCSRPKVCGMNQCRGEDVTRITNIHTIIK
jgi:V8-like Glu-specific endopeptidase